MESTVGIFKESIVSVGGKICLREIIQGWDYLPSVFLGIGLPGILQAVVCIQSDGCSTALVKIMGIIKIGIYESSIFHCAGCTPHSGIQSLLRSIPILVVVDDASIAGVGRGIARGHIGYYSEHILSCYMPVILDFHVMAGLSQVHIGF